MISEEKMEGLDASKVMESKETSGVWEQWSLE